MVYVPGGSFWMGGDESVLDAPRRVVTLPPFFIDQNLVTAAEYHAFAAATGRGPLSSGVEEILRADAPVIGVTWEEARAYAAWKGKRLPTEAEWEKAARGIDGRTWPWGNAYDPARVSPPVNALPRAGSRPGGASPYQALDMVGTIFQWTADRFPAPSAHFGFLPADVKEAYYVVKGGCFLPFKDWMRPSSFYPKRGDSGSPLLGFRCAQDAPRAEGPRERLRAWMTAHPTPSEDAWTGDRARDARLFDLRSRSGETASEGGIIITRRASDSLEALRQILEGGLSFFPGRTAESDEYGDFMKLREGDRVADIGCGTGWFSIAFARRVGPRGRAYAVDINPGVLPFVEEVARAWGVNNVVTVCSRFDDICLPPESVNHVFLFPTYHYIIDNTVPPFGDRYRKVAVPFLASVRRALVRGGHAEVFNEPEDIAPERVRAQFQANGFRLVEEKPSQGKGHQFYMRFEKI
ncbi:MAG: methyltransferase domain-containing protein [Armatimonadetes bacterium]|nr:methyltransferase domain-containing protein [Armatimonadota bacterium]